MKLLRIGCLRRQRRTLGLIQVTRVLNRRSLTETSSETFANMLEDRFDIPHFQSKRVPRLSTSALSSTDRSATEFEAAVLVDRINASTTYTAIANLCLQFASQVESDTGGLLGHVCNRMSRIAVDDAAFAVGNDPSLNPHARSVLGLFAFIETCLVLQRDTTTPFRPETVPAIARTVALHTRLLVAYAPRQITRLLSLLLVYVAPHSALPRPASPTNPNDTLEGAADTADPAAAHLYMQLAKYLPPSSTVARRGAAAAALVAARRGATPDAPALSDAEALAALEAAPRRSGASARVRDGVIGFLSDAVAVATAASSTAPPAGWAHALALSASQSVDAAMSQWSSAAEAVTIAAEAAAPLAGDHDDDDPTAAARAALRASTAADAAKAAARARRRAAHAWLTMAAVSRALASVGPNPAARGYADVSGAARVLQSTVSTFASVPATASTLAAMIASPSDAAVCFDLGRHIAKASAALAGNIAAAGAPPRVVPPSSPRGGAPPPPPTVDDAAAALSEVGAIGGLPTGATVLLGLPAWALADIALLAATAGVGEVVALCVGALVTPIPGDAPLAAGHSLRSMVTMGSAVVAATRAGILSLNPHTVALALGVAPKASGKTPTFPSLLGHSPAAPRRALAGLARREVDSDPAHRAAGGPLGGIGADVLALCETLPALQRVLPPAAAAAVGVHARPLLEAVTAAFDGGVARAATAVPAAIPRPPEAPERASFLAAMAALEGSMVADPDDINPIAEGAGAQLTPTDVAILSSPQWVFATDVVAKSVALRVPHPALLLRPILPSDVFSDGGRGLGNLIATQRVLAGGSFDSAAAATVVGAVGSVAAAAAAVGASPATWRSIVDTLERLQTAAVDGDAVDALAAAAPPAALWRTWAALLAHAPPAAVPTAALVRLAHGATNDPAATLPSSDGPLYPLSFFAHVAPMSAVIDVAVGALAVAVEGGTHGGAFAELGGAALRRVVTSDDHARGLVAAVALKGARTSRFVRDLVAAAGLPPGALERAASVAPTGSLLTERRLARAITGGCAAAATVVDGALRGGALNGSVMPAAVEGGAGEVATSAAREASAVVVLGAADGISAPFTANVASASTFVSAVADGYAARDPATRAVALAAAVSAGMASVRLLMPRVCSVAGIDGPRDGSRVDRD